MNRLWSRIKWGLRGEEPKPPRTKSEEIHIRTRLVRRPEGHLHVFVTSDRFTKQEEYDFFHWFSEEAAVDNKHKMKEYWSAAIVALGLEGFWLAHPSPSGVVRTNEGWDFMILVRKK